jgi:hypothetical protein
MLKQKNVIGNVDAERAAEAADLAQKGVKGKSPETIAAEVAELIEELRNATEVDDKKRIRRNLRARGHMGGLRLIDNPAAATKTPPTTDKKAGGEAPAKGKPSTAPAKTAVVSKRANKPVALKQ